MRYALADILLMHFERILRMKAKVNENLPLYILYFCAIILFITAFALARSHREESITAEEYAEYEKGNVTMVLSDNTERDPSSDNSWRASWSVPVTLILLNRS